MRLFSLCCLCMQRRVGLLVHASCRRLPRPPSLSLALQLAACLPPLHRVTNSTDVDLLLRGRHDVSSTPAALELLARLAAVLKERAALRCGDWESSRLCLAGAVPMDGCILSAPRDACPSHLRSWRRGGEGGEFQPLSQLIAGSE